MAFCINCGAELFETSRFCPECGTPVEKREEAKEQQADIKEAAAVKTEEVKKEKTEEVSVKADDKKSEIKEETEEIRSESDKSEDKKEEAEKASEPKTEETKAEAPKTEEPKAEEIKTETPKTEEAAKEEPKADAQDKKENEKIPAIPAEEKKSEEKADASENVSAEEILESIPDIKKLDGVSVPSAKEPEPVKSILEEAREFAASENIKAAKAAEAAEKAETVNKTVKAENKAAAAVSPEPEKKKKSKAGVVVLIIFLLIIGGAAALYFMGMLDAYLPASVTYDAVFGNGTVSETIATETAAEVTEPESETVSEMMSETAVIESEISETAVPESETTVTEPVVSETAETETDIELETDASASESQADMAGTELRIMPEHVSATANQVSCEISLSAQGVSGSALTDDTLIVADYTTVITNVTAAPVSMVIVIGETEVAVMADSYDQVQMFYSCASVKAAVTEAGFTADDIDVIRFKSTGAPADVSSVTFMFE